MAGIAAPLPSGDCMVRPTPNDPCPFAGKPGAVSMTVKNVSGSVIFLKATYEGGPVVVTPQTITFTIVAGAKNLDIEYFFSDVATGQGSLHEVCPGNTFLGDVFANIPVVRYKICA